MFTGLIEELGKLRSVRKGSDSAVLTIAANKVLSGTKIGDSIAVNGVCLTVTSMGDGVFTADAMFETLNKTNLSELKPGDTLNLERALQMGDRLGGHMVSGHVDGTGYIRAKKVVGIAVLTEIAAPAKLIPFILPKGSVAIDGISLTVVETGEDFFSVSLIPLTAKDTILGTKDIGAKVNLETDMLGKYVHRFMQHFNNKDAKKETLTVEFLSQNGFI